MFEEAHDIIKASPEIFDTSKVGRSQFGSLWLVVGIILVIKLLYLVYLRQRGAQQNTQTHWATSEARRRTFRVLVSLVAVLKLINVSMGKWNYLIQTEQTGEKEQAGCW